MMLHLLNTSTVQFIRQNGYHSIGFKLLGTGSISDDNTVNIYCIIVYNRFNFNRSLGTEYCEPH